MGRQKPALKLWWPPDRVAPTASILLVLSGYVGPLLVGGGHDCRQIETTQEEHGGLSLQRPDGFSTPLSGAL